MDKMKDNPQHGELTSALSKEDAALYGTYTVDKEGNFAGNRVEGSSFPNWVGNIRTTDDLSLIVEGNSMTELFFRPSGAKVEIIWKRVQ